MNENVAKALLCRGAANAFELAVKQAQTNFAQTAEIRDFTQWLLYCASQEKYAATCHENNFVEAEAKACLQTTLLLNRASRRT